MKRTFWVIGLVSATLLSSSCHYEPSELLLASWHARDVEEWRERRVSALTGDEEYLRLVGLHWIEPGSVTIGSDPQSEIQIPVDSGRLGVITVERMRSGDTPPIASFTPAEGAKAWTGTERITGHVPLLTDAGGDPTVVRTGDVSWYLIERNERLAVRVLDENAPALLAFDGIEYFPIDERWVVEGRFEEFSEPRTMEVADVSGGTQLLTSPGRIHFEIAGRELSLDVVDSRDDYWIIFSDATNGVDTYGAGRYLYTVGLPEPDGSIVVDFNRAYNPPCAFSPYATCPLPPPQNRLPVPVTAGEKDYGEHEVPVTTSS